MLSSFQVPLDRGPPCLAPLALLPSVAICCIPQLPRFSYCPLEAKKRPDLVGSHSTYYSHGSYHMVCKCVHPCGGPSKVASIFTDHTSSVCPCSQFSFFVPPTTPVHPCPGVECALLGLVGLLCSMFKERSFSVGLVFSVFFLLSLTSLLPLSQWAQIQQRAPFHGAQPCPQMK